MDDLVIESPFGPISPKLLSEKIRSEDDLFYFLGIGPRYGQSTYECEVLPELIRKVYRNEQAKQ
jgi:hypothetical protein